jgi:hypothetical protein
MLPSRHSAYRQYHSTETVLAIVHNDIVRSVEQQKLTAFMLLDLKVDLINVLEQHFAADCSALKWFRSHLPDRTQTFTVGDDCSATYVVNCSAHHGSVLGPAELIAYIEDVVDVCNIHQVAHHMFAGNQQLYLDTTVSRAAATNGRLLACIRAK